MRYRGLYIGVVYKYAIWSERWLQRFREDVDQSAVAHIIIYEYGKFSILMRDGTKIYSINMDSYGGLGHRFDKVYIEPCIDINSEYIRTVILPTEQPFLIIDDDY